jgi:uncharacterized membrane protein
MDDTTPKTSPEPTVQPQGSPPVAAGGFDFNQPTIISLLYLASAFLGGLTAIVGVVLAFMWKGQPKAEWEVSHYQYLINTFWIGLIGSVVGVVLLMVLIGIFVLIGVGVLVLVRSVMSLINAQKHAPMPNPDTWLI